MVGGDIVILCYWYTPLGVNVPPTDVVMWIHLHYYSRENYALPHDIISKSELIQPVPFSKSRHVNQTIMVHSHAPLRNYTRLSFTILTCPIQGLQPEDVLHLQQSDAAGKNCWLSHIF